MRAWDPKDPKHKRSACDPESGEPWTWVTVAAMRCSYKGLPHWTIVFVTDQITVYAKSSLKLGSEIDA